MAQISSMFAGWPYKCTGTITFVRGVIAFSTALGSMHQVSGSTSTITAFAPQ